MIVAAFFRGPFDGKRLVLPCEPEDPWKRFVIPRWDSAIELETFYLLAGRLDQQLFAYLEDDSYGGIITTSPS